MILDNQVDPEEDLLADPIAALTDEVNVPVLANQLPGRDSAEPDVTLIDGRFHTVLCRKNANKFC